MGQPGLADLDLVIVEREVTTKADLDESDIVLISFDVA